MNRLAKILLLISIFSLTAFGQRSAEQLKRYAIRQMKIGKYAEAIDVLNKYVAQNPQKADGYNLRGLCYEVQGIYKYAVLDFRRAVALDPGNPEYKKNLNRTIKVWYKILESKIEGHKRELAINPESAIDYLEIGKCYRWMEKWDLAEKWYDEYLKRDPNASPDEIIRYTIILTKTKHIKKGEKILKKYVERYPDDWRLWSRYGYFTLWLGKYKTAENAFRTALSFKPYFKEAEDGLELAMRKGYLVQYQPRDFEKVYLIDKYYRQLSKNPENDNIRFKLVRELLNKKRYQEAKDQLAILAEKYSDDERYKKLKERLDNYYKQKIAIAEQSVAKDSTDRQAILDLAKNYMNLEEYDKAKGLLEKYLKLMPDDFNAKYELAKVYSYQRDFDKAYEIIKDVLDNGGNKLDYKLLAGQLGVWTLDESEAPKENLYDVLKEDPKNVTAITTLGLYYYNQNNLDSLQHYVELGESLAPDNDDVKELSNMYELLRLKKEYEKYLTIAAEGDSLYHQSRFEEAVEKYKEYFSKPQELNMDDYPVLLSLASAYMVLNKYDSAAMTYDKALALNDNEQVRLLKAKSLFWGGDSTEALQEFEKLAQEDSTNAEVKVFLGDSYLRMKEFDNARKAYDSVPDSLWDKYSIEKRLSWLPPGVGEGGPGFFSSLWYDLFSYLYLNPYIYYFNDLLDFTYGYIGVDANTGLFRWISVGAGYRYGILSDGNINNYFHRLMFYLHIVPTKKLRITGGIGRMFGDYYNRREYEVIATYADSGKYSISGFFQQGDGAEILYSPYLVPYKITSQIYKLSGYYNFPTNLTMRGYWAFLRALPGSLTRNNWGNDFLFRIGRHFGGNYILGYEFNYIDYQFTSTYYYSPQDYSSHSIWGEWNFYKDKQWNLKFSGKIGYVPKTTYFIWDARLDAGYKPYDNLFISGFVFFRQSQRYYLGYRSHAIGVSLQWTPF